MRRNVKNRNTVAPDPVFNSEKIEKFVNYVMLHGKKQTARNIVYGALDHIKTTAKVENPIEVFERAIKNAGPNMEVRSRRVGGANYQVPREVRPERKLALAMRWIIDAADSQTGKPMMTRLADELLAASNNEGAAVTKKENTHKMAEANKAFAHFAW